MFFMALLAAVLVLHFMNQLPRLPRTAGDWGSKDNTDPRIAAAGMLYAVAVEDGPLTPGEERQILSLLEMRVGLEPEVARTCLKGGRRLANRLRGDLNSRLHQLAEPIRTKCSAAEKTEAIDMLKAIAGPTADNVLSVRDGIGRLAATLRSG